MVLRLRPELVGELARTADVPFGNAFEPANRGWTMPDRSDPGHVGDPRSATAEKGEVLFQCFSEQVVKLLERVIAWDGRSWEG